MQEKARLMRAFYFLLQVDFEQSAMFDVFVRSQGFAGISKDIQIMGSSTKQQLNILSKLFFTSANVIATP